MFYRTKYAFFPLVLLLCSGTLSLAAEQSNPPRPSSSSGAQNRPESSASWAPVAANLTAPAGEPGDLIGATIQWQYYAYGAAYQGPGMFVDKGVSGGTFVGEGTPYFNILAKPRSITFDYSAALGSGTWSTSVLSLAPTVYNGIAINILSGPPLTSVTIDRATNMPGFDASHLSFTANQIQVDWQGLAFTPTTIVRLDVNQPRP